MRRFSQLQTIANNCVTLSDKIRKVEFVTLWGIKYQAKEFVFSPITKGNLLQALAHGMQ